RLGCELAGRGGIVMATLYRSGSGYTLQVTIGADRRTKRLGKLLKKGADDVRFHVNQIEQCRRSATILPAATTSWLEVITDDLHGALADAGLCSPRQQLQNLGIPTTLGKMFQDFLDKRTELKPYTRNSIKQALNRAVDYFGTKPARDITAGDAKDYRRWLVAQGYAQPTVAQFVNKSRQMFNEAIDHNQLSMNPFRKVLAGTQVNEERRHFVGRDDITTVINATGSVEWKLLIALARYAGIRVPSEASLLISDVDFENGRIIIRSPKTERQHKPKRTCPLFPELRPYLVDAVAAAKGAGREKLIPFIRPGYNPHTQLERLVERAKVKAWPKLWANMRSTRETELLAEGHPIHVVCAWIGNTERVARKHYLQVRQEDWDKATGAARAAKSAAMTSGELAQLTQVPNAKPAILHQESGFAVPLELLTARDRTRTCMPCGATTSR
ncbi:MAG: hypothetical protein JWM57_1125, partial [Phycisphaerales bacterium]|nr:hypothetical protein [Phycisphaerales bacterium]